MKITLPLNQLHKSLPPSVAYFLKKALIIFIAWKVLYHLVLVPLNFPDGPLTILTGRGTEWLYSTLTNKTVYFDALTSVLYLDGKKAVGLAHSCNGLELIVLYVGFLLCIPNSKVRVIAFALAGTLSIVTLNCFRCFALAWLYSRHYDVADFAHHYLFTTIVYALIFLGWTLYTKDTINGL
jgi:exosortase/archaeosortase family protein